MDYVIYVADTETTGLDPVKNDVIELSLYRLSDDVQKTWCLKPTNFASIEAAALRINGHKLEDITHQTKQGREQYGEPSKVIVEIENWMAEDAVPADQRILVSHNVMFDKWMMEQLWVKCGARDTFPFGRRTLDTMSIAFFWDWCKGELAEGYHLGSLTKKYGITNSKAHTAEADTRACKEVFMKQVDAFRKVLNAENIIRGGT
jgi:DNA polymerase III epsilon subunit-like protein